MKSNEEYRRSIFKKRDALLAKRKKNIKITLSTLGIAICICSVISAKEYIDRSNTVDADMLSMTAATTAPAVDYLLNSEPYINTEETEEKEVPTTNVKYFGLNTTEEFVTDLLIYQEIVPETDCADEVCAQLQDVQKTEQSGNLEEFEGKVESEGICETPDCAEESPADEENTERVRFTENDIIEEAKKYLTDEEKNAIIQQDTNAIVSRKSTGETAYTVYFKTDAETITVTLNANDLGFIEKGDSSNKDKTQTTPAFNPGIKNGE